MHTIPYPVICGFVLLAYFLPTVTAFVREHKRLVWICLANILVGWTVLGWALVALWAMSSRRHHRHIVCKRQRVSEPSADQDPEIAQTNATYRRPATVVGHRTMARRQVIMAPDDTAVAPYPAALEEEYAPEWRHFSPRSVTEYD